MECDMIEEKFMRIALKEANKAKEKDEVPIGAVIVVDDKVIAKAFNKRNASGIATHHAEILAIEKACKKIKDWRLEKATLYVTLQPCPMCAGAAMNARINKIVFGAFDRTGLNKNLFNEICEDTRLNHKIDIQGGVLEEECSKLLTDFFAQKRKTNKK